MDKIEQTYEIAASPEEVWRALTDPELIREWSGAAAEFPLQAGAKYSLWDGSIVGEIIEIIPEQKLVQTWKPQDWTRTDSVVTFALTPQGKGTRVDLVHVNVEESDYEGTNEGWDIYYLGEIKRMLEARAKPKPKRVAAKKRSTKTAKKPKAAKKTSRAKKKVTKKR